MENVQSILLKGYYGFGNLGDDLLMIISYKLLRSHYPTASITVFSNHTVNLESFHKNADYNLYIHRLLGEQPKLIDWTYRGHFDLVFNGGGGVFFDATRGSVWREIINKAATLLGPATVRTLGILGRRVMKRPPHISFGTQVGIGIGLGPYAKGSGRMLMHLSELGSFQTLLVRDPRSFDFLRRLGFNGNKILSSDLAFAHSFLSLPTARKQKIDTRSIKLGIILQDIPEKRSDLFSAVKRFVASSKYEVTFFSFDENYDKDFIASFSSQKLIIWQPDKISLNDFSKAFSEMDMVMSARAHGTILAALLGVVPITLNISQKLEEVSRYFPEGGLLVKNPFDISSFQDACEKVEIGYEALTNKLSHEVKMQEDILKAGMQKLFRS